MIDQWVKEGIEQGLKLGREEDWKQGVESNIKKMLQKGFTVQQIVDILEVPEEMVLSVKEKYEL